MILLVYQHDAFRSFLPIFH